MIASYDLLALGAAACWALGSVTSASPARHLGAFAFTRWRMLMVAVMLWTMSFATGGWQRLPLTVWGMVTLSGLIGIFIGDTALYAAMNRLGPRRAGVLFATHAVFSALLGFWLLGERMSAQALAGASLTVAGVMVAILLGRHKQESHAWEADLGHVGTGVLLGLLSALCQAVGALIIKPVMVGNVDPIAASALRVTVACAAHFVLLGLGFAAARDQHAPTRRVLAQTALNGFIAVGVGMTLLLMALKGGGIGMVAILSSVSPVLVLPLLWLHLGRAPAPGAWLGAALTVLGTALILSR
jgi:drug/metabolite transporter (DMT)-like permease